MFTLLENWVWRTECKLDPKSLFPKDPGELKIDVERDVCFADVVSGWLNKLEIA